MAALGIAATAGYETHERNIPMVPHHEQIDVTPTSTLDAGVLFLGTETYQCFPLNRFGLHDPTEIISIDTSCERLVAQVTEYVTANGERKHGLQVNFLDNTADNEDRSYSLAAKVKLHLRDQATKEITIRFIHAFRPAPGGTP